MLSDRWVVQNIGQARGGARISQFCEFSPVKHENGAMRGMRSYCFLMALALGFSSVPASGQTDQFLPEVDVYYKLNSDVRISMQVKQTREGGDPNQAEIGPSLDFYLKPLIRLTETTEFDLDDAKSRPLVLSVGYRYLPQANGGPATNRMEPVATVHFPLKGRFLLTDRNRADLDWKSGSFTWRYRNRPQMEKVIAIRSYHLTPYASAEFFYESEYRKWSDTAIYVGCLFPIGKHVQIDSYYEHQNNTGKSPNQQLNQLGLVLNLYF